jgi:hypothetical protein
LVGCSALLCRNAVTFERLLKRADALIADVMLRVLNFSDFNFIVSVPVNTYAATPIKFIAIQIYGETAQITSVSSIHHFKTFGTRSAGLAAQQCVIPQNIRALRYNTAMSGFCRVYQFSP